MATDRKLVPGLIEGSFMFTTLMLAYTFPYYDVILTRLLTCTMGPNSLFRCIRTHCNERMYVRNDILLRSPQ